jgi:hypothetical protein
LRQSGEKANEIAAEGNERGMQKGREGTFSNRKKERKIDG